MASSDAPRSQRHWPGVGVGRSQDEFLECLGSPQLSGAGVGATTAELGLEDTLHSVMETQNFSTPAVARENDPSADQTRMQGHTWEAFCRKRSPLDPRLHVITKGTSMTLRPDTPQ